MLKRIFTSLLIVILVAVTTGTQIAFAESGSQIDQLFEVNYGQYKNEDVYYHIDYIDPTELEEESFFDRFKILSNLKDGVVGFFYNILHEIFVALPFFIVKSATTAMIWLFNKIYEVNFVDSIVGKIASQIQAIAGISGGNFKSTGLFGGFLGIATGAIALYTLYQFIVKRASISAFSGLLKSLIALVIALAFFSNYTTIISGLNKLSVEASGLIVSGGIKVNSNGNITNSAMQNQMNDNLWNTFVHKPYLMLQYGTMDQSSIGNDRVLNLLKAEPDSENRYNLVKEEILDKNNEMMSRNKIFERWGILAITSLANFFNSIPILLLAFALIFFQFWFTAMAMIAPFVFIWSAFPNQFRVLGRYLVELITPLILKLGVSILALIIFSLTSVLTNVAMNTLTEDGLLAYIFLVFIEGILFFTLFLLRHRILNIFSVGSKQLAHVREEMSGVFTQPFKKGVQMTATGIGTVAGAMTGGLKGAMAGSSIGSSIGQAMTGDKSLGDAGRDIALNHSLYESLKAKEALQEQQEQKLAQQEQEKAQQEKAEQEQKEQVRLEQEQKEQEEKEQQERLEQEEKEQQAKAERFKQLSQVLGAMGLSDDIIKQAHEELEKRGITNITPDEIQSAYDTVRFLAQQNNLNKPFAQALADEIEERRLYEENEDQEEDLDTNMAFVNLGSTLDSMGDEFEETQTDGNLSKLQGLEGSSYIGLEEPDDPPPTDGNLSQLGKIEQPSYIGDPDNPPTDGNLSKLEGLEGSSFGEAGAGEADEGNWKVLDPEEREWQQKTGGKETSLGDGISIIDPPKETGGNEGSVKAKYEHLDRSMKIQNAKNRIVNDPSMSNLKEVIDLQMSENNMYQVPKQENIKMEDYMKENPEPIPKDKPEPIRDDKPEPAPDDQPEIINVELKDDDNDNDNYSL